MMCLCIAVAAVGTLLWWRYYRAMKIRQHQLAVTEEIRQWGEDYRQIRSQQEARRAVEMLRYIRRYYVPRPGYRGDQETEDRLEAQRKETTETIRNALNQFTGSISAGSKDEGLSPTELTP